MKTIEEYLFSKNVKYKTSGKNIGRNFIGIKYCPFCNDDGYHLGINLQNGLVFCWKCGNHNLTKFIQLIESCSWLKAKTISSSIYFQNTDIYEEDIVKDETAFEKVLNTFTNILPDKHKKYLEERKFDPYYLQKKHGVLASLNTGSYKFRLIIPIIMNRKIVSFVGRDVTEKQYHRYKYCDGNITIKKRKELIYNLDKPRDKVILVEGIFDSWRLGDSSAAMLSTYFSNEQILEVAKKKFKRIFILFDPEEQAQKKSKRLAKKLSAFTHNVEIINLDIDRDPADMTDEEVRQLKREIL